MADLKTLVHLVVTHGMEIHRIVIRLAQTQPGIIQTRRFPRIGYGLRFNLEMSPSRRFDKLHCSSASAAQPPAIALAALPFGFLRGRMKDYVGLEERYIYQLDLINFEP